MSLAVPRYCIEEVLGDTQDPPKLIEHDQLPIRLGLQECCIEYTITEVREVIPYLNGAGEQELLLIDEEDFTTGSHERAIPLSQVLSQDLVMKDRNMSRHDIIDGSDLIHFVG